LSGGFEELDKRELHDLADGLLAPDPAVLDTCIRFVLAATRGNWHGRARAMMCRRMKHCEIGPAQRKQLVDCIVGRLRDGNFSEQFYDQLRLAIRLDPHSTFAAARTCSSQSPKTHVRRYALWVTKHDRNAP
jgi:hypothetical protein